MKSILRKIIKEEIQKLNEMKSTLQQSIICSNLNQFIKVLEKLQKMKYKSGQPGHENSRIDNYGIAEANWKRGIRIINLYNDNTIKFASDSKNLKNKISDIDFLKK